MKIIQHGTGMLNSSFFRLSRNISPGDLNTTPDLFSSSTGDCDR